jgi:uncharacterized membrane protein YphA (DoxX/SURF4 family)
MGRGGGDCYSPVHMAALCPVPLLLFFVLPRPVLASDLFGGAVLALGLIVLLLRGEWRGASALDRLILFGPIFYAVPIAAFGAEHLTLTRGIASIVPAWMPWHLFWACFVGICLVAAALSLVTGVQTRLAAGLLALMFFLFVVLMDAPGWAHQPGNRFTTALLLRELAFSGGPLGLALSLSPQDGRGGRVLRVVARCFVAVPVLYYCVEQFLHPRHVPGIPLELVPPAWIHGHAGWTVLTALVYSVAGPLLLVGWKPRLAAGAIGAIVLLGILGVYVPLGLVEHASLDLGINYPMDTLMFCGTVLMLAAAMPREDEPGQGLAGSSSEQWP